MAASLRTLLFAPGNDARKTSRALAAPVSAEGDGALLRVG